jgi:hypothetical protein
MYYGPELISEKLRDWAKRHGRVELAFIRNFGRTTVFLGF